MEDTANSVDELLLNLN